MIAQLTTLRLAWSALPRPARWLGAALVGLLALAALVEAAEARVGGGQGYSSGRRSSSRGGGGGGEGDLLIDIAFLLIHLAIRYPAVGVPLLLLFIAAVVIRFLFFSGNTRPSVLDHEDRDWARHAAPARQVAKGPRGLDAVREADPAFSMPVFLDFAGLVHRRALAACSTRDWAPLAPFVSDAARKQLEDAFARDGRTVKDVVLGSTAVGRLVFEPRGGYSARVEFESNATLVEGGRDRQLLVRSEWVFRRGPEAITRPPDETLSLACPSCSSPIETDKMGSCKACGTAITRGQLEWQVAAVDVASMTPVSPPALSKWTGGDEPSVDEPTRSQRDLPVALRAFQGRHPDFEMKAFEERIRTIYAEIQAAWSENRWERARPYVTDPLYQQLRFWIDGYLQHGLRNQLTDVQLHKLRLVKVEQDAWYDAITVRIWGSMKDATIDASGKVVGGSDTLDRRFSEYWTFLRASGTGADSKPPGQCPSCGAPLDRIGASGVCGYCDSKITTGRFDWVLSRIDQTSAYRG